MSKKALFYIIVGILSLALVGTLTLVQQEIIIGDQCPKILNIPACYIVSGCFSIALIGHLRGTMLGDLLFRGSIAIVTITALFGTTGEIFGFAECPKTSANVPMCYISFSMCISAIWARHAYNSKAIQ